MKIRQLYAYELRPAAALVMETYSRMEQPYVANPKEIEEMCIRDSRNDLSHIACSGVCILLSVPVADPCIVFQIGNDLFV